MQRALVTLAVIIACLAPAFAAAQDRQAARTARALFDEGIEAARAGRFAEAATAFERSLEHLPRASTHYNLAIALDRIGRVREAIEAIDAFLRMAPPDDPARRDAQERRLAMTGRLVTLRLSVSPPDAVVEVDGRAEPGRGSTREIALDPGDHVVRVSAPDHRRRDLAVDGPAGAVLRESVRLDPLPDRLPTAEPSAAEPATAIGTLGLVGIAAAGVGVAAGIVSLATGLAAEDIYQRLEGECPEGVCPAEHAGAIEEGRALAWTSTGLTIAAGVALAAGLGAIVVDLAIGPDTQRGAAVAIAPGRGGLTGELRLPF